ncbi:hypothetical protein scyTo_0022148, partial [Scyliorhinus torazame]|nr:hypothetical protein [Scyliorhinus torazame]
PPPVLFDLRVAVFANSAHFVWELITGVVCPAIAEAP